MVGEEGIKQVKDLNRQSVVRITGAVQETKSRDFPFEVKSEKIEILSRAVHPITN
uniref:hypothetical protein n=1 Tax=Candidatus Nitrosotalea sp. TS TaxID=2341020 RepID=UPI002A4E2BA3|nr:hypothetical protein [Candidatus Nitrosotalea sp. TS]